MEYVKRNKDKHEQIAEPGNYPQKWFKDKPCKNCSKLFTPKAPCEKYCSDLCKNRGLQNRYFIKNYGLTVDKYESMLQDQNHLCAICHTEGFIMNKERHKMKLVVDHCHTTGVVRGLLCHNCNRALGLFQDSQVNLTTAINYLKV
ncbi:MAG: recombination endonuclease VII [Podoviridae sp. ctbj_2]|nr:MAG: recombination endonuclease VII [Podoviridae sp. ctbj_2]